MTEFIIIGLQEHNTTHSDTERILGHQKNVLQWILPDGDEAYRKAASGAYHQASWWVSTAS